MSVLKCKYCGGSIEVIDSQKMIGQCDSCGSKVSLPNIDDENIALLFNRGNMLRMKSEFDKAITIFEKILDQNDKDAEAHWCLTLCRYGIEYVEDPISGDRIPTCHRVSYDLILNDENYKLAVEYADEFSASIYMKEAKRISDIQKNIITKSKSEEAFDIFISYKESTGGGSRTKDSKIAQEIYNELISVGYRVFFSRITLEDKLGSEYEPIIFSALNSAQVMIVVGTSEENFNSVWVKNEWSRFLNLIKKDSKRTIIPCYRDMDPYNLPDELALFQAQDLGKIGFIQDITRGLSKLISNKKETSSASTTKVNESSLERLVQNSKTYLNLLNYDEAKEVFTRITKEFPEDYRGWWGLIECETLSFKELNADLNKINTWFEYVRKLSNSSDYQPLFECYKEYQRNASTRDAEIECSKNTEELSKLKKEYNNQIYEVDHCKKELEKIELMYQGDIRSADYSAKRAYDDLVNVENSYKFGKNVSLVTIAIGGLLLLIALSIGAEYQLGMALFFSSIVVIIIGFSLLIKNEDNTKRLNESRKNYYNHINITIANKRIESKQKYDSKIHEYKIKLNEANNVVSLLNNSILRLDKYQNQGKDKIAEIHYYKRMNKFDIEVKEILNDFDDNVNVENINDFITNENEKINDNLVDLEKAVSVNDIFNARVVGDRKHWVDFELRQGTIGILRKLDYMYDDINDNYEYFNVGEIVEVIVTEIDDDGTIYVSVLEKPDIQINDILEARVINEKEHWFEVEIYPNVIGVLKKQDYMYNLEDENFGYFGYNEIIDVVITSIDENGTIQVDLVD